MTFEKIENLKNKVVVITGGYGQVGKAASKRMAELGATVIIISRKKPSIYNIFNAVLSLFF